MRNHDFGERAPVRATDATNPAFCMEFRARSNGITPGPQNLSFACDSIDSSKEVECHGKFSAVITFQLHWLKCVSLIVKSIGKIRYIVVLSLSVLWHFFCMFV